MKAPARVLAGLAAAFLLCAGLPAARASTPLVLTYSIREARAYLDKEDLDVELQVDGGIKIDTAPIVAEAGADILVSGSGIFPDHVAANLKKLREVAERSAHRRS